MKTNRLLPSLLLAATLPALAEGPPNGPRPAPLTIALDKNRDHEISKREIRNPTTGTDLRPAVPAAVPAARHPVEVLPAVPAANPHPSRVFGGRRRNP